MLDQKLKKAAYQSTYSSIKVYGHSIEGLKELRTVKVTQLGRTRKGGRLAAMKLYAISLIDNEILAVLK